MNLKALFPKASASFIKANEKVLTAIAPDMIKADKLDFGNPPAPKRRGHMNKTEREFSLILEAMKRKGEILRYEFEGITLRFAGVRYTPDFVVFKNPASDWKGVPTTKFIEVKGAFVKGKFERAVERFRHAKTFWHEFQFELHQKTKDGWQRIL